jgi:hypothetical protein
MGHCRRWALWAGCDAGRAVMGACRRAERVNAGVPWRDVPCGMRVASWPDLSTGAVKKGNVFPRDALSSRAQMDNDSSTWQLSCDS